MSDSASDGAGEVSDQASDTMSDTLSDALFLTTPDAPEVRFLEPVQAGQASDASPPPLLAAIIDFLFRGIYRQYLSTAGETRMDTARIFQSDRSQAVRLPKAY